MYPTLLAFCNEVSATLARLLAYIGAIVVLGLAAARDPKLRGRVAAR